MSRDPIFSAPGQGPEAARCGAAALRPPAASARRHGDRGSHHRGGRRPPRSARRVKAQPRPGPVVIDTDVYGSALLPGSTLAGATTTRESAPTGSGLSDGSGITAHSGPRERSRASIRGGSFCVGGRDLRPYAWSAGGVDDVYMTTDTANPSPSETEPRRRPWLPWVIVAIVVLLVGGVTVGIVGHKTTIRRRQQQLWVPSNSPPFEARAPRGTTATRDQTHPPRVGATTWSGG